MNATKPSHLWASGYLYIIHYTYSIGHLESKMTEINKLNGENEEKRKTNENKIEFEQKFHNLPFGFPSPLVHTTYI